MQNLLFLFNIFVIFAIRTSKPMFSDPLDEVLLPGVVMMPENKAINMADAYQFSTVPGRFYGPCSGRDLPLAFQLFGDRIDRFTFCDLAYRRSDINAANAVPTDWCLISRFKGRDERQPTKHSFYARDLIQPHVTLETWWRPDGSEVHVELRCDLAQEVLVQQFAPGSISAFMHVNDGTGEGGSNMRFLMKKREKSTDASNQHPLDRDWGEDLLDKVITRLADGAVVVSGNAPGEPEFSRDEKFDALGIRWEPLGEIDGQSSRKYSLWRAIRPPGFRPDIHK